MSEHLGNWTRIGRGLFMLGRFRNGLEAILCGERGDWCWSVDRRLPPTMKAEKIAEGQSDNKLRAMIDAETALENFQRGAKTT
jgi:hypothetical protein